MVFQLSVFSSLGSVGPLEAENFIAGAKALDTDDYFVYNNGTLYYDADGSGKKKAVAVVTLTGAPELGHENFWAYVD